MRRLRVSVIDRKLTRRKVLPWIGGAGAAAALLGAAEAADQEHGGGRLPPPVAGNPGGLWFTDVGGVMDGSQQGAKLQQWLNLAETQSHVALLPPGDVTCDRELVVPDGVRVVGAGIYASQIQWLPLAAGQSAMRSAGSVFEIGHLHLRGPGGDIPSGGATVAAMDGLKLSTRSYVESVRTDRFHAGTVVTADHVFVNRLEVTQNEYGLLWDNANTSGDYEIFGVLANGCSKAGIGITNRGMV
jgi:hypothetical protein